MEAKKTITCRIIGCWGITRALLEVCAGLVSFQPRWHSGKGGIFWFLRNARSHYCWPDLCNASRRGRW